ncbi:MAG TPA: hypothetical protein VNO21_00755 [Polyangiaceae bacterium]|nr:hypothetical protein [Polyangiaceae bacterium]
MAECTTRQKDWQTPVVAPWVVGLHFPDASGRHAKAAHSILQPAASNARTAFSNRTTSGELASFTET